MDNRAQIRVSGGVQQVLDAIADAPAWVRNARHDMLAANRMARALYAPMLADPRRPANNARFVYLDPASRSFFADGGRAADDIAAMLRSEAGRNPHDRKLVELIGSCPPAATTSVPAGPPTTCASTGPGTRNSATPSSATST
jgi:hypothetical protein